MIILCLQALHRIKALNLTFNKQILKDYKNFIYKLPGNIRNIGRWDTENIFKDRDFLLLWISQVTTLIGGSILGLAVAFLASSGGLENHHKMSTSSLAMGMVILVNNLPSFFVAFIAGVLADWFDRRKIMLFSNLFRIVMLIIFLVFSGWSFVTFAYLIIFLKAVAKQFFIPAEASLIPDIVKKKNILTANSIFNLTNYITYVFGFVLAGPVLLLLGPGGLIIFLILMFIIASIAVLFIRIPKNKNTFDKGSSRKFLNLLKSFFVSFKDGFKYILQDKVQRIILVHNLISQSLMYIVIALVFKLGAFLLNLSASSIGIASMMPLGIGIFISILMLNFRFKYLKRFKLSLFGVYIETFAFGILSIASFFRFHNWTIAFLTTNQIVLFLTSLGTMFIGLGFPLLLIPGQTLMQEKTKDGFLGRVYGIWLALSQALAAIPAVIFGYFADYLLGVPTTLVWIMIFAGSYSFFLYKYRNLA